MYTDSHFFLKFSFPFIPFFLCFRRYFRLYLSHFMQLCPIAPDSTSVKSRSFSSIQLPIYYSLSILSFDAVLAELPTASLSKLQISRYILFAAKEGSNSNEICNSRLSHVFIYGERNVRLTRLFLFVVGLLYLYHSSSLIDFSFPLIFSVLEK
jgi:hypothetical protein